MYYDDTKTLMDREIFLCNFRLAAKVNNLNAEQIAEKSHLPLEKVQGILDGTVTKPIAVIDMHPLALAVGSTVDKLNGWC